MRLCVLWVLAFFSGLELVGANPKIPDYETKVLPFFEAYCIDCHGPDKDKGGIRFDEFPNGEIETDLHASDLQDAIDAMNSLDMPPEDEPQPTPEELEAVLDALYTATKHSREFFSHSSKSVVRRINNRELVNILDDKFGIKMDTKLLIDDGGGEFDTLAESLPVSSFHLQAYEEFALSAVDRIFTRYYQGPGEYRKQQEVSSFMTEDRQTYYVKARMRVPTGHHTMRLKTYVKNADGRANLYVYYMGDLSENTLITGTEEQPQWIEYEYYNDGGVGDRMAGFRGQLVIKLNPALSYFDPDNFPKYLNQRTSGGYDNSEKITAPYLVVESAEMVVEVDNSKVRQAFGDEWLSYQPPGDPGKYISQSRDKGKRSQQTPTESYPADEMAGDLIGQFYQALHSTAISDSHRDSLVRLFESKRRQGKGFWEAVYLPLSTLLSSPTFLYQSEASGSEGTQLAQRMARFLWSSQPDSRLMELGASGELLEAEVFRREFNRMFEDDEKIERFVRNFVHQWFEFDRIDTIQYNTKLFPDFEVYQPYVRSMKEEVYLYIKHMLQANHPIRHFVDSNYTFADDLLARHYSLDAEPGGLSSEFQKVNLGKDGRRYGGLLSKGAISVSTANGNRTSPVERGAFVLRKFLDDPPPPAPPNVPMIEDATPGREPAREILKAHTQLAQCASCHRKIDNLGFGLENFDPIGRWRTQERRMDEQTGQVYHVSQLDVPGYYGDTAFTNYQGFKKMLLQHEDRMARAFVKAVMGYSLGRHSGFGDTQTVEAIIAAAEERGYRLRDLVYHYVRSDLFRK